MKGAEHGAPWPAPSLLALPDGKVHLETSGDQSYLVTKYDWQLALWITSLHDPQTNFVQTQISLLDPLNLTLPYMQAMTLGLLWANPPGRICLLGLGGGAMARVLHHHLPGSRIDCVDVSATVIRLAEEFFGLVPDDRLQCHHADAANFLRYSQESYNLILIDVFEDKGRIPRHLGTREFFDLCKRRLSPAGVVVMNISSAAPDHLERANTFRASFDHVARIAPSPQTTIWFGSPEKRWDRSNFMRAARRAQRSWSFRFPFVEWVNGVEGLPALTAPELGARPAQATFEAGVTGAAGSDLE
jgi:spermidine synthase